MAKRPWDIAENPKNKRWYLSIDEGLALESYPSVDAVRARASELGVDAQALQADQAIEKNLAKARAIPGEEFSFPVTIEPTFDVRITVSPDKTSASLYIRKSSDKKNPLDMRLISAAINSSKLVGMDAEAIKAGILAFRDSSAMELPELTLAKGVPAQRGKNRELKPFVDWLPETDAASLAKRLAEALARTVPTDADKALPPSEATRLALVEEGFLLYEISPPEPGESGRDVYGKDIPGLPGNDPFVQIIEGVSLGPLGFKADKTGVLLAQENGEALKLRVIAYRDAKASPAISEDAMTATLTVEKGLGAGKQLNLDFVKEELARSAIKSEILWDAVERAIAQANETGRPVAVEIARGICPTLPGNARVRYEVGVPKEGAFVPVDAETVILSYAKLQAGADGMDVTGKALPASSAKPVAIPEHDDTIREQTVDGETTFIAAMAGDLVLKGNALSITDTREMILDVTEETGDVVFPANLSLTGSIASGRAVKAKGRLTVTGNAAASLVYCEGSVTMIGGIKGAGRGTAWAKDGLSLTFAENAKLLAGGDIKVENYCFQCTVKTNGMLLMKGNPAVLLGGNVRASRGVEVFELGSEKTIRTSISFGQNYLVSDQIEVSEREVAKIKEAVARIDAEMQRTSTTNPRIHELRRRKLEFLKKNDKLTVRIFTLKEQYETHVISHVRVENTVYPGVILESHGRYYEVRERKNHVVFFFDQKTGQIVCSPIDDSGDAPQSLTASGPDTQE